MPYDANGLYTPEQPAINPGVGRRQEDKNNYYGVSAAKLNPRQEKEKQAPLEIPTIKDYLQTQARNATLASGEPFNWKNATDQDVLELAKPYGENILGAALKSRGHTVNDKAVAALFNYQLLSRLPELRKKFTEQELANAPPEAVLPEGVSPTQGTLGNLWNVAIGSAKESTGDVLAGLLRNYENLNPINNITNSLMRDIGKINPEFGKNQTAYEAAQEEQLQPFIQAAEGLSERGRQQKEQVTPEFAAATGRGLLDEQSLGDLGTNLLGKTAGMLGALGPQAAAAGLTRGASLPFTLGLGTGEASRREALNRVMALPQQEVEQLPEYQALKAVDPSASSDDLRRRLAERAAGAAEIVGQVGGAASAAIPALRSGASGILGRLLGATAKQGAAFGAQAAAQEGANVAAQNLATGEERSPLAGAAETAAQGALPALLFGPLAAGRRVGAASRAAETPVEGNRPPETASATETPTRAPETPTAANEDVATALNQAFEEFPLPTKEQLTDPNLAKRIYENQREVFEGTLSNDFSPEQINQLRSNLAQAWVERTGVDPTQIGTPEATTPAAAETATPAELSAVAETAPAAEASAPEISPLEGRVARDLQERFGRQPTPEEVTGASDILVNLAAEQQGIDPLLPKPAIREAINNLLDVKGSNELPTAGEINKTAKKLLKKVTEAPPKKVEAGEPKPPADELKTQYTATPEERAARQTDEATYTQHQDVFSAVDAVLPTLEEGALRRTAARLLNNPFVAEKLRQTRLSIRNPEDADTLVGPQKGADGATGFVPGAFQRGRGVELAGSGWKIPEGDAHGLNPATLLHEATHAGLAETLTAVERGELPALQPVFAELNTVRQDLINRLDNISLNAQDKKILQYGLSDPHEFLSVTLTSPRIQSALQAVKLGKETVWKKLVNVYNRLLGNPPADESALQRILNLSDKFIDYNPENVKSSDRVFRAFIEDVKNNTAERVSELTNIKPEKQSQTAVGPSRAEALSTKYLDYLKPWQFVNRKLAARGISVGPKENVENAARVFQSRKNRLSEEAQLKYVQPAIDKLYDIAQKNGKELIPFIDNLKDYYLGKHAIERNKRGELEETSLTEAADAARQAVREAWARGELTEGRYTEALDKVVNAPGARRSSSAPPRVWAGFTNQAAQGLIAKARKAGITPEVVAQFEPIRKQLLEVIDQNNLKSRKFSASDAARRSGLGWKWYLPMKGLVEGAESATDLAGNAAFLGEYKGVGGRGSQIAENPIVRLFQDVVNSETNIARNELTDTIYRFAKKYGKDFGLTVKTLPLEKNIRETVAAGKGLDEIPSAYKNENTILHNNGEYRYSIEFPKNSPELKALEGLSAPIEAGDVMNFLSHGTNLMARGATVLNPSYLLWTSSWRDALEAGTQVAADLGGEAALRYTKNYLANGGPLRALPTYFAGLKPRNAVERSLRAQETDSHTAKVLDKFAQYGGEMSFGHELNALRNMDGIYRALESKQAGKLTAKEKAKLGIQWLDQLATAQSMASRVAAFDAYVETATKKKEQELNRPLSAEEKVQIDKDGVLYTRRILDFLQKGEMGAKLNMLYPFTKVALTQMDRIASTFKNPDGTVNKIKLAKWVALGTAMGYLYMETLRQANPSMVEKQEDGTLTQNFLVPVNGDNPVKIPMGYGLQRLVLVPGIIMNRLSHGEISNKDATNLMRNVVGENLTPLRLPTPQHNATWGDQFTDLMEAATPGLARPVVESALNRDVFGGKITRENAFDTGAPHAESGRSSTPETWKTFARTLNDLGIADVYPETLEHIVSAYGTAPATALLRGIKVMETAKQGGDIEFQRLPFVPSLTSKDAQFKNRNLLSDLEKDLAQDTYKLRQAERNDKLDKTKTAAKVIFENKGIDKKLEIYKEIQKLQSKYGKERASVDRNKLLSPQFRRDQLDRINKTQAAEEAKLLERAKKL